MTQALTSALLHFIWQGALVAFMLWVALAVLRNRSANARYVASCAALAVMAMLPLITIYVSYQGPAIATTTELLAAIPAVAAASPTLEQWLLPVWFAGVFVFSIRLLWGCRQVSGMRRRGEPAEASVLAMVTDLAARMRIDRPVRVLISSVAQGPSAIGWIRPVVLLPAATVLGLSPQQLEAVLAHELAHIRRLDYLINIIQMLVETVLFYHPAVWWTSARIRHERELCCDDAAVGCCGDALCYARALTTLERLRITTPRLVLGSTGGSMLYRIERLVGVAKYQNSPSRWPGVLALCLGLAVFAMGQAQRKPVEVDLGKSVVVNRPPVEYPEAAIEKSIQGTLVVEATLDQNGAVTDARVVSGPAELRKAALQSVLDWHFTPESGGTKRRVSISFQTPAIQKGVTIRSNQGTIQSDSAVIDLRKQEQEMTRLQAEVERAQAQLEARAFAQQRERADVESARRDLDQLFGERARMDEIRAKLEAQRQELEAASRDGNQEAAAQDLAAQRAHRTAAALQQVLAEQERLKDRAALQQHFLSEQATLQHEVEQERRGRLEESDARFEQAAKELNRVIDADRLKAEIEQLKAQLQAVMAKLQELQKTQQK